MRTKVLFMSLVLGCLWSCQQDETKQTDGQTIKFTSVEIGRASCRERVYRAV